MKQIAVLLSLLCSAFAIDALTFNEALSIVIGTNSQLQISEAERNSELYAAKAENNLSNPEISFDRLWTPHPDANKWELELSQDFDWPGAYKARSAAAQRQSEAFAQMQRKDRADLLLKAKLLMINIVTAKKRLKICEHIDSAMHELDARYKRAYELGECTILDVNKIRIESASNHIAYTEARTALRTLTDELSLLAGGRNCDDIVDSLDDYPSDTIFPVAYYEDQIRQSDPSLMVARSDKDLALAKLKVSRMEAYPSFKLAYLHQFEDDMHLQGFSVGMSIPLFSHKHKKTAAKYGAIAADVSFNAAEIEAITTMNLDYNEAVKLMSECEYYDSALQQSDNFRLLKMALDGGEISLLTYIQEVSYFLDATDRYLALADQAHQALARLNRLNLPY